MFLKMLPGKIDVVICNPPYTSHNVSDDIDRMYWDPNDEMKKKFFNEVRNYLKDNGRIYFGWANFADIAVELPLRLAQENNLTLDIMKNYTRIRGI
jgi:tRNA1(Val) A37 N6-methylase TrmN6